MQQHSNELGLTTKQIVTTWWPLAFSWLLMSAEQPALAAVVLRLPNGEINMAAFGGITFPLALIIEAPIIMLLAASTALSKDWDSFQKLKRYMFTASVILTIVHILVAFTPLYDFVARVVLGSPAETIEPGRIGLMIFTPWTWAIAYRRFHQGMLIRFNRSYTIGAGTLIRISANVLVLVGGFLLGNIPGIVVASCAVIFGVFCEAVYVGIAAQQTISGALRRAVPDSTPLNFRFFMRFYIPLVLTSLLVLLVQPIGSAALGRMPMAIASLAAWPVVAGLVMLFRSLGTAFNEVVVALLHIPKARQALWRFCLALCVITTLALLAVTATPLSAWWFGTVTGLEPDRAPMAMAALWFLLPLPALTVLQSWYQGSLMHHRQTRSITESVVVFLVTSVLGLAACAAWSPAAGLYSAAAVFTVANLIQTGWLWMRAKNL